MKKALASILLALALVAACMGAGPIKAASPAEEFRVERLRIGWYDGIGFSESPRQLADWGFDLVLPYVGEARSEEVLRYLAGAAEAGIDVVVEIPRSLAIEAGSGLDAYVSAIRESPALDSWYLYDEPEWKPETWLAGLRPAYARIKALDPNHPATLVFMFPFFAGAFARSMDSFWVDCYPFAEGSPEFAAFREGYLSSFEVLQSQSQRLGKNLGIVLQGFGQDSGGKAQFWRRLPSVAETRTMLLACLAARPSTILFWALYRSNRSWIESALLPAFRELRSAFPRGIVYYQNSGYSKGGEGAIVRRLGDGEGKNWILLVSNSDRSRTFTLTGGESSPVLSLALPAYGAALVSLATQEAP
ncbi:MAG: hypothetical protein WCQ50_11725 [Spirochaetota bacterium]